MFLVLATDLSPSMTQTGRVSNALTCAQSSFPGVEGGSPSAGLLVHEDFNFYKWFDSWLTDDPKSFDHPSQIIGVVSASDLIHLERMKERRGAMIMVNNGLIIVDYVYYLA